MKKKKFQDDLSIKLLHINLDHCYSSSTKMLGDTKDEKVLQAPKYLVDRLYKNHIWLDTETAIELERNTRLQSSSELWHSERKLRITASIMREVCHRKESTSCSAFIQRKLMPTHIDTKAVRYGKRNEEVAVKAYANYQYQHGTAVKVCACGLYVDPSQPWLAASPDGIVLDMSLGDQNKGCLEVKCPLVCEKIALTEACRTTAAFCLVQHGDQMCLSKSHGYYYQVQTQMHVTHLQWCDFVVWSPIQEPFVQRVQYDAPFVNTALSKARSFYFEKFLPSVVSNVIMSPDVANMDIKPLMFPVANEQPKLGTTPAATTSTVAPVTITSTTMSASTTIPQLSTTRGVCTLSANDVITPIHSVATSKIINKVSLNSTTGLTGSSIPVFVATTATSTTIPLHTVAEQTTGRKCTVTTSTSSNLSAIPATLTSDVQIIGSSMYKSLTLDSVLQELHVKCYVVSGDGSCLYHAVAHQAGFISKSSRGDKNISGQLRQLVVSMMVKYPDIRTEDGLTVAQWLQKKIVVLDPLEWGGDLELRLLAIGLKRDNSCDHSF